MKAVIQRSKKSFVCLKNKIISSICFGLVVFICVVKGDTNDDLNYLVKKISNIRIFNDNKGKLNKSLLDVSGSILLISQFTLCADTKNGRRPSFISAEKPEIAKEYYQKMIKSFKDLNIDVQIGEFQTDMSVSITNDGPITILIDTKEINTIKC